MSDPLDARLERFLAARLPDARRVRVVGMSQSTEGFSQETFSVDAVVERAGGEERRGWIVKREPVAGLLEPYDLEPEFRVLHALSADPLLSPPAPWFERDPAVLERPFYVMERLPGEVPIPAAGPEGLGPFAPAERAALGPEVAAALARLHAVDWRARELGFLGVPAPGPGAATREVARWRDRIARAGFPPIPIVAEAFDWLARHAPEVPEVTLVHGDFRLGNLLVARDGGAARLTGILDWEMVHLGDPLEDLAWCTSPLWRGGTPLAGCLLPPDEFEAAYAAVAGRALDRERLRFWSVLGLVKMIAIMLTGLRAFGDGRTADLRLAIFDHQLPFLLVLLAVERGWLSGGAS
jgi:aminoglycoside phosphotransferase (APT) family kinase protein